MFPYILFFCKSCRPKVSLSLKFFHEIQDKQSELDERLQELESKLTSKDGNLNVPEENNSSTADTVQPAIINTQNLQHNQKFMHGIDECEKGAPRNERSSRDFSSVTEIIAQVSENISPLSIHDLYRLGKYQEQSRLPRPILIKFNRAIDVSILPSKTSALPKGI